MATIPEESGRIRDGDLIQEAAEIRDGDLIQEAAEIREVRSTPKLGMLLAKHAPGSA